jgi:outer membrane immunogenic protein
VISISSLASQAADLPPRMPEYPAPPVVYNWTGFYLGINGGYGWGKQDPLALISSRFDNADFSVTGGVFGVTSGAELQLGHVVLGVETDLDWADVNGSSTVRPAIFGLPIGATVNLTSKTDWVSTARTRVGYASNNWLFYSTVGAALLNAHANGVSVAGVSCGTAGVLQCLANRSATTPQMPTLRLNVFMKMSAP